MRNNLRIYRAIENITQQELADELGVSRQTIVAIENDKYNPSLELAFKIAHRFDVKIEDITEYTLNVENIYPKFKVTNKSDLPITKFDMGYNFILT